MTHGPNVLPSMGPAVLEKTKDRQKHGIGCWSRHNIHTRAGQYCLGTASHQPRQEQIMHIRQISNQQLLTIIITQYCLEKVGCDWRVSFDLT